VLSRRDRRASLCATCFRIERHFPLRCPSASPQNKPNREK
jgi:hypothetical protein